ncbi:MAG: GAF domain-containing protein, partial [Bacteroidia bacterium]|nr:GAF domain-containing protein [Bacteroidia bacterium]
MAESLFFEENLTKIEKYYSLRKQLEAILANETDWVCALATTTSALKMAFSYFWVGFYRAI